MGTDREQIPANIGLMRSFTYTSLHNHARLNCSLLKLRLDNNVRHFTERKQYIKINADDSITITLMKSTE